MSIITCTAKTRNDLSVARVVIEVLAQKWNYPCSVTYNDGKSFDVKVKDGSENNAISNFKRLAPDLDIYKSDKKVMATSQKESRKREAYNGSYETVMSQYLRGEMTKNEAISALIDLGEAKDNDEALEIVLSWNESDIDD